MTRPSCQDTLLIKKRDLKNNYFSATFRTYSRVDQCRPGQFVHIQIPSAEIYFRRAMSIAGVSSRRREIEVIFKVVGRGTRQLGNLHEKDRVNLLGPLGVPFRWPRKSETAVIVAGGVGFPPLLYLASEMVKRGHDPRRIEFFYGGRSSADLIERSRIRKLGVRFHPVTEDGSVGEKGLVTGPVEEFVRRAPNRHLRLYGCGPEGMLKATNELGVRLKVPGQISLEAPMPCGIGICLGCVVPLVGGGHARVCWDGPVFEIGEVAL
ncbi:MAG: dihydroorotate dehydrogenase electron transfer subunit [Candidatus Zixiibacteriota bacterium]|nr:MAG: dihydroorotate dehydrogenase electron transfer subunit [candidate division Zixibacteria bacterium]